MPFLRSFAMGLRSLFRWEKDSRELDEELDDFLEMAIEEKMVVSFREQGGAEL